MKVETVLVVGLALVGGAAAGWLVRRSSSPSASEEARVKDLEDQLAELRRGKDAGAAMATGPTLEPAPPPATPPSPRVPPPGATPPPPAPPATAPVSVAADFPPEGTPEPGPPKFLIAGHEEALRAVDWNVVGKNLSLMAPAISKFGEEYARTGRLPAELVGRVQELNGPLVTAALKARDKMGLTNPNGAFSHPAFMANAIAATLEAAGKPLTEDQGKALAKLASVSTDRDRARASSYDENTFALARTIDDAALRDDFFTAAAYLLTPEQVAVLWPAGSKGRLQLDLFSSGVLWATVTQSFPFKSRDALVEGVEQAILRSYTLPEDRKPIVHDAVVEWANGFSREVMETPGDPLSKANMLPVPLVTDSAKRMLALKQRLIQQGRFEEGVNVRIRASQLVLVPLRTE